MSEEAVTTPVDAVDDGHDLNDGPDDGEQRDDDLDDDGLTDLLATSRGRSGRADEPSGADR